MTSDEIRVTLRDGGHALLRPLQPGDRDQLVRGFEELSAAAREFRFGHYLEHLPEDLLDQLLDIDGVEHLAWAAVDGDDESGPGLGVARCRREPFDRHAAEATITVAEGQRNRGIATVLLGALAHAALAVGITEFRMYVLRGNAAMIEMLDQLGGRVSSVGEHTLRIDLPLLDDLPGPWPQPPPGPAARALRSLARMGVTPA